MQIAPELELHIGVAFVSVVILMIFGVAIRASVRKNDVREFWNGGMGCLTTGVCFLSIPYFFLSGAFKRAPGKNAWVWIEILGITGCSFLILGIIWLTLYFRAGGRKALAEWPEEDGGLLYILLAAGIVIAAVTFPIPFFLMCVAGIYAMLIHITCHSIVRDSETDSLFDAQNSMGGSSFRISSNDRHLRSRSSKQ